MPKESQRKSLEEFWHGLPLGLPKEFSKNLQKKSPFKTCWMNSWSKIPTEISGEILKGLNLTIQLSNLLTKKIPLKKTIISKIIDYNQ